MVDLCDGFVVVLWWFNYYGLLWLYRDDNGIEPGILMGITLW